MNEMYNMGIVTHYYGVVAVLGVILLNLIMIIKANSVEKYKKFNTLFNPVGSTFIGTVIFTGIIMMAAKHLEFTLENIAMIIFAIVLIVLEVKRSSRLKYLNKKEQSAFGEYKIFAYKVLLLEVVVTLSISAWMLI